MRYDSELYKATKQSLHKVLVALMNAGADLNAQNQSGLYLLALVYHMKFKKSWMKAVRASDQNVIAARQELHRARFRVPRFEVENFLEEYDHFSSWGCWPATCNGEDCAWWEEYGIYIEGRVLRPKLE